MAINLTYKEIHDMYLYHYNYQKGHYPYVMLTKAELEVVLKYAMEAAELRWGTPGYEDIAKEKLRENFFLGGCAETAVAKLLGRKQSELCFEVRGKTIDYAKPDLWELGYDCGVKASTFGLFPLILKKDKWREGQCGNEIFCTVTNKDIIRDKDGMMVGIKGVYVNGLADERMQKTYQSERLVYKKNKRHKDRTGFYGFDKLWTLDTEEDIEVFKQIFKINRENS